MVTGQEEGTEEAHRGRKAGCPASIWLVLWKWRQSVRRGHTRQSFRATELGMKMGDWRDGREGKDPQLACLLDEEVVCGFPGNAYWSWGWDKAMRGISHAQFTAQVSGSLSPAKEMWHKRLTSPKKQMRRKLLNDPNSN